MIHFKVPVRVVEPPQEPIASLAPARRGRLAARWTERYTVVALASVAVFVCFLDRVSVSIAIIPMADEFGWSETTQGTVFASFFVGYALMQVVGGRLADRFGGGKVLAAGVLLWSVFTLLTPSAALVGFTWLILARVALGLGEAVSFPAITSIYTRAIPLGVRARAMGVTASAIPLGTVAALAVTPIITATMGWEWAFYLFGATGVLWFLWWRSSVVGHPDASIRNAGQHAGTVPWRGLFASAPVWALIIAHFSNNWSMYVLLSWWPTFLTDHLGVDIEAVGWFAMIPYLVGFVFINIAGHVGDRLLAKGIEVRRVRKLMQTTSLGGIAVAVLAVAHVETAWGAVLAMSAGHAAGAFGVGGALVNHMDIAPRHAGALAGITNTAGALPGIAGVFITGWILDTTGSWPLVLEITGAVSLAGMVVFLLFSSGQKQFD